MASPTQSAAFVEVRPWEEDYLRTHLPDLPLRFFPESLSEQTAAQVQDVPIISTFIRSPLSRAVLDHLPKLRFIATRSTGYDQIDVAAVKVRGVVVSDVPRYGANTVAEYTFGLMLCLSRKIIQAYERALHGQVSLDGLEGFDLNGKTLGVIGTGSIGVHVVRIARGVGMDVLAYDVKPQPLVAEVLGFAYVPLVDLLRRSDVVSLHVPATPQTHHLMNRERFGLMKHGSSLINTARGDLVDAAALAWALDEGILAGAGLDVVEGEELVAEQERLLATPGAEEKLRTLLRHHVLLRRENGIITPHAAFYSREALQRILDTTISNIRCFLAGQPENVVS
ncbi:MAG TPA: NAD(P)-dependent oxidoreductase [Chloroflexota bacterium]|nr:NAD(P)-dependent oxidoreductase [Chloroflexota bacterium]